jgi:hypothetical protein
MSRRKNPSTAVLVAVPVTALAAILAWKLVQSSGTSAPAETPAKAPSKPATIDAKGSDPSARLADTLGLSQFWQQTVGTMKVPGKGRKGLSGVPVYRPIRAVSPYGNAPASRSVATGLGSWPVRLPSFVGPYLPQGSTMAYGRLGIARSASTTRRPYYGSYGEGMDPITGVANAISSVFGFGSQISASTADKKNREAQAALAAQQQKLDLLMLQQSGYATASSERTTIFLVGGGLVALTALGVIAMNARRRKNGRRRNGFADTSKAALQVAAAVAAPIAMGVSYSRNHSLGWAFLSGFVGIPYLVYAGLTPKARRRKNSRRNRSRR